MLGVLRLVQLLRFSESAIKQKMIHSSRVSFNVTRRDLRSGFAPPTKPFIHHIQMIIIILREWIIWIYYFFIFSAVVCPCLCKNEDSGMYVNTLLWADENHKAGSVTWYFIATFFFSISSPSMQCSNACRPTRHINRFHHPKRDALNKEQNSVIKTRSSRGFLLLSAASTTGCFFLPFDNCAHFAISRKRFEHDSAEAGKRISHSTPSRVTREGDWKSQM